MDDQTPVDVTEDALWREDAIGMMKLVDERLEYLRNGLRDLDPLPSHWYVSTLLLSSLHETVLALTDLLSWHRRGW
jgi:hypothetical protein